MTGSDGTGGADVAGGTDMFGGKFVFGAAVVFGCDRPAGDLCAADADGALRPDPGRRGHTDHPRGRPVDYGLRTLTPMAAECKR